MADEATRERADGPTPNGGAYAVAYFRGADGSPCPKGEAVGMEVVEYDEGGGELARTYMAKAGAEDAWMGEGGPSS